MPADLGRRGVVRVTVLPRANHAVTKDVGAACLHRPFPARLLHLRTALPLNATDFLTGRYANDAADRHTIDGKEI